MNTVLSLVTVILMCLMVLVLAWASSRFLGKTWRKTARGRYIHVIDQVPCGQDRYLMIVKIKDENYLVGSANGDIRLLSKLEGDFKDEDTPSDFHFPGKDAKGNFKELLVYNFKKYTGHADPGKDVLKK